MRVIIAGGGTGGHLFPGIALAEEFLQRSGEAKVLFIGTERGMEAKLLPQLGFELKTIDVEGIKGRGLSALIKSVYQIPVSMWQSRSIIKEFKPNIVIGVGGYASGPAVIAAYLMKIPTAIAEQNALPGITNRILGKFVKKIFVTYRQTTKYFAAEKVMISGNPVLSNNPGSDARSGGLPPGHAPLHAFMGLPLYRGEQIAIAGEGTARRPGRRA